MKHLSIALIYIAFFGLIGFAVYFTNTVAPLWALLLTPTYSNKEDEQD
jgi:hypothetical protein